VRPDPDVGLAVVLQRGLEWHAGLCDRRPEGAGAVQHAGPGRDATIVRTGPARVDHDDGTTAGRVDDDVVDKHDVDIDVDDVDHRADDIDHLPLILAFFERSTA